MLKAIIYTVHIYIYIYTGKDCYGRTLAQHEKELRKSTQSVLRLVQLIIQSRRNVTGDNWFSSIELVQELKARDLTYVGTLKKNKPEVPKEFLPNKARAVNSCIYGFTNDMTLLSYVPKQNKAVLMISSMHHSVHVDEQTKKPEIIALYNSTKGGVDGLDQKIANYYSSNRRTRRWPMAVFFTIIDVSAGVNAFVIHQTYEKTPRMKRMEFMKDLAFDLIKPFITQAQRLQKGHLPRELSMSMRRILQIPEFEAVEGSSSSVKETKNVCFMSS